MHAHRFSRLYREEPGLRVRRIDSEPLFVAVPTSHALLRQGEVRIADLRDEDMVLFPQRRGRAVTGLGVLHCACWPCHAV